MNSGADVRAIIFVFCAFYVLYLLISALHVFLEFSFTSVYERNEKLR